MKLTELLKPDFDIGIRARGEDYYKGKRLNFIKQIENTVHFVVIGTEHYKVVVSYLPKQQRVETSCNCPFSSGIANCKHIWAVLLYIDAHDVFSKLNGRIEAISWLQRLEQAQVKMERDEKHNQRRSAGDKEIRSGRSGVYALDVEHSIERGQICLHLFAQERLKNGTQGVLKPADLTHDKIELYEDPQERDLLWNIIGPTQIVPHYFDRTTSKVNLVYLTPGHTDSILREVSKIGKLNAINARSYGFGYSRYDKPNLSQIYYDDRPWQFVLNMERTENGYQVIGSLRCHEAENRPVNSVIGTIENFVFFKDRIVRSDLHAMRTWGEVIKDRPLFIVDADLDAFLEYYWSSPGRRPILDLPTDLIFEEKQGELSQTELTFESTKSSGRLAGNLAFYYEAKKVLPNTGEFIYSLGKREKLKRDLARETDQVIKFSALQAIPSEDVECLGYFTFDRLVEVSEKAFANGWRVSVKGQRLQKGGELRIDVKSGVDWFDLNAEAQFGEEKISLPLLLRALRNGERTILLGDGSTGLIPEDWRKKLEPLTKLSEVSENGVRLNKIQALFYSAGFSEESAQSWGNSFLELRQLVEECSHLKMMKPDAKVLGTLRDYQKEGLSWLSLLTKNRIGGILADDMGLGKTVQILALLSKNKKKKSGIKALPTLVVAPKSLVFNWENEAKKFTPHLKVVSYVGSQRRQVMEALETADVVLTTYSVLRIDIETLMKLEFDFFILDEAHNIKNAQAQVTLATRMIKAQHKFGMTGTPIENSLMDLFSILSVVNPGLISSQQAQRWAAEVDPSALQKLSQALRPFILRRTKEAVVTELPAKTEQVIYCDLSQGEMEKYNELKAYYWGHLSGKIEENGLAKSKIEIFEALLRLRQAACHQGLLGSKYVNASSTKFEVLLEQLSNVIQEGHKALVFSQFTSLLRLLETEFKKRNMVYEYLDGSTENRAERVTRFQEEKDCKVFLLSLKAGGVGLNLTAADYVFILDPWWNPAAEAQAIDRTHRIGQDKKVFAYRLIAKNTVEEKILMLQERKKTLAKSIITGDVSMLKSLKIQDLEELFN